MLNLIVLQIRQNQFQCFWVSILVDSQGQQGDWAIPSYGTVSQNMGAPTESLI